MWRGTTLGQGTTTARQQHNTPLGNGGDTLNNASSLAYPINGLIKETGEEVMLLQTCDWPGHSPAYIGVDGDGNTILAAFDEIRVTDFRALPNPAAGRGLGRQTTDR